MKEDFFLLLMISKHWTGTFFPGKSDFVDFTTHLISAMHSRLVYVPLLKGIVSKES